MLAVLNHKIRPSKQFCKKLTENPSLFFQNEANMHSIMHMFPAGHGMEWNGNFGMEYRRCQNGMEWKISRMEWKTIFHTSIPIPYKILCIVFTEKYIPMSGSDNNIVTEVFNFNIYAYYLSTNRTTLVVYIAQCTYCIIVSKLQFNCSSDVTVDDLDRFDLLLFFILRLTICPVVNFVFLHRHKNSYLLFHPRFSLILYIFLVFKLKVILFGVKVWHFYYGKCSS